MRILVTGGNGFVGRHLERELINRNHDVYIGVRNQFFEMEKYAHKKYVHLNIMDMTGIEKALVSISPEVIIHLAAQSSVSASWEYPADTLTTNIIGTVHLVEAIAKYSPHAKLITIGSSEEYGLSAKDNYYLKETTSCLPQNPYAISKLTAFEVTQQLAKKYKLNHIHLRPFNHFGPGQKEGFVISDFASEIAKIEAGISGSTIKVGYLGAERDFTDVRDIVRAYVLIAENEVENGVYNIASGVSRKISTILDDLIQLSTVPIKVNVDSSRFRISEVQEIVGDYTKIKEEFNWKPQISFQESLVETLNWWRKSLPFSVEQ
ncbi:GDP-mannose 4,6-dehydratase [Bacillus sp. B1-b2]|uniref:GDP-mannose 4,6-dehydratase n=1 Tax=Bacillus sp. B1-b2 TaxID=2653201 RepID=UPI0012627800|nr:GDP-mannose 4,6-dehydratase [Bacillus sp. B1-b2]KAB7671727.1 NAD-dependent epimerase/dehydratase family protein [Bacillus sp. B1-b2]